MPLQGRLCDAAVNFDTYRSLEQHRTVFTAIPWHSSEIMEKSRQNNGVKYVYLLPFNFTI